MTIVWQYYAFSIARSPVFMIITPSFSSFVDVFSNQDLAIAALLWILEL
jgi:hypothetical protein